MKYANVTIRDFLFPLMTKFALYQFTYENLNLLEYIENYLKLNVYNTVETLKYVKKNSTV